MARQFLAIPAASATAERVFSFAGLTLSDLRKSLLEGTLESIMWTKWGSPSIPEEETRGTRPVVTMRSMTLPVVTSYELDLPKGKRARTQFDREVDAIYRRISGGWRK